MQMVDNLHVIFMTKSCYVIYFLIFTSILYLIQEDQGVTLV